MTDYTRTIAAIATPPGKGGVALIRVSGSEALSVVSRVFRSRANASLRSFPPRKALYGDFLSDEGECIDDGLIFYYPAPHSYTGEDTVELSCHGGILVSHTILEALFAAGASPAEAGEFTRRALLHGKLSLSEAEAVGALLDAKTDAAIRVTARESRTALSQALSSLTDRLLSLLSSLYAVIDYPEEDLTDMTDREVRDTVDALYAECVSLLSSYRTGRAVTEGIPTVIVGVPNVGKSSLYNLLGGDDAAIVTSYAGTTRDILERTVTLGDIVLRVSDTAGLRETADPIEQMGVERARQRLDESELVLFLLDGSTAPTDEDIRLLDTLRPRAAQVILLLNKADLGICPQASDACSGFPYVLPFSVTEGDLTPLVSLLSKLWTDESLSLGHDPILTSARQAESLRQAVEALSDARESLRVGMETDAVSSVLEVALKALSALDGREVSEEIVSRIFSRFCVGK